MPAWVVHLALFIVALIYGATYSIAKMVIPHYVAPAAMILLRIAGASLLFWTWLSLRKSEPIQSRSDFVLLALCGLFGIAANQLLFFEGLARTTPINASLIMTTTPILVLLISAFWLKEKITWLKSIGIALGLTGAILLIGGEGFSWHQSSMVGDFMVWINALSYGIYLVLVKPLMQKYKTLTVVRWSFLFGLVFVLPFGLPLLPDVQWQSITAPIWWAIGFLILFTTFVTYMLNAWTLRFVSPSIVGFYIYLQPVLATLIALMLGKDQLTLTTVFYSSLIFAGVLLVSIKKS
jgi:drug/metabolite transporter (DMT)-like permease